jgi:hypothetical protein
LHLNDRFNCFCGVDQAGGSDLAACQFNADKPVVNQFGYLVHGWCYIDTGVFPAIGDAALTARCDLSEPRALRFVGDARPAVDAVLFMRCGG